jgi:enoyl-[acyl-carrier protein] reductase I
MIDLKGKVAVVFGLAINAALPTAWPRSWLRPGHPGPVVPVGTAAARGRRAAPATWARPASAGLPVRRFPRRGDRRPLRADRRGVPQNRYPHPLRRIAPADAIKNDFLLTVREDFRIAHDVSVYSLIALARRGAPDDRRRSHADADLLRRGEGLPQLQRHGRRQGRARSDRPLPRGSLGRGTSASTPSPPDPSRPSPRAASATSARSSTQSPQRAPLHRNVEQAEVGNTALFLCSPLASGITGESPSSIAASTSPGFRLSYRGGTGEIVLRIRSGHAHPTSHRNHRQNRRRP